MPPLLDKGQNALLYGHEMPKLELHCALESITRDRLKEIATNLDEEVDARATKAKIIATIAHGHEAHNVLEQLRLQELRKICSKHKLPERRQTRRDLIQQLIGAIDHERRKATDNEHIVLMTEVDGLCPKCGHPLLYKKNGSIHKKYDIAHIYPLNPTANEVRALSNEDRLSDDPNALDNLIPLCKECHRIFDHPRTAEEYREMIMIKRQVMAKAAERASWAEHRLEVEIEIVVKGLLNSEPAAHHDDNDFYAKTVDQKTDDTLLNITRRRILQDVQDYYQYIRDLFRDMEMTYNTTPTLIAAQVKQFYLTKKKANLPQEAIYHSAAEWIQRTSGGPRNAAEIVTSFFVQNCEIFS